MKRFLPVLFLVFMAIPAVAQAASLTQVQPDHVCMVNDTAFEAPQIPVEVGEATYYGCCQMCEARLQKDAAIRMATDPVSGAEVDKAEAVIGKTADNKVYYFENEENMDAYDPAG